MLSRLKLHKSHIPEVSEWSSDQSVILSAQCSAVQRSAKAIHDSSFCLNTVCVWMICFELNSQVTPRGLNETLSLRATLFPQQCPCVKFTQHVKPLWVPVCRAPIWRMTSYFSIKDTTSCLRATPLHVLHPVPEKGWPSTWAVVPFLIFPRCLTLCCKGGRWIWEFVEWICVLFCFRLSVVY